MPDDIAIGTWEAHVYIREINPCWLPIKIANERGFNKLVFSQHFHPIVVLGNVCRNGEGEEQNCAEAEERRRKAIEPERAEAQHRLGNAYYHGHGVEQNYKEAVKWLLKAAEQRHGDAVSDLRAAYNASGGVEQSCEEAVKQLLDRAEREYFERRIGAYGVT
jgi:hypothetical protein